MDQKYCRDRLARMAAAGARGARGARGAHADRLSRWEGKGRQVAGFAPAIEHNNIEIGIRNRHLMGCYSLPDGIIGG